MLNCPSGGLFPFHTVGGHGYRPQGRSSWSPFKGMETHGEPMAKMSKKAAMKAYEGSKADKKADAAGAKKMMKKKGKK